MSLWILLLEGKVKVGKPEKLSPKAEGSGELTNLNPVSHLGEQTEDKRRGGQKLTEYFWFGLHEGALLL